MHSFFSIKNIAFRKCIDVYLGSKLKVYSIDRITFYKDIYLLSFIRAHVLQLFNRVKRYSLSTEMGSSLLLVRQDFTLWRVRQLSFLYVQILPQLKNSFVLKDADLLCWGIIKVKFLYKITGIKFSSLELKLSGFATYPWKV